MFKKTKRRLKLWLLTPTLCFFIMSFLLSSISLSTYNKNNYIAFLQNSIAIQVKQINLEFTFIKSFMNSLTADDEVLSYINGNLGNESYVKSKLNDKTIQLEYILGNSLYPVNDVKETSDYQIGGLVDKSTFLKIPEIKKLIDENNDNLVFIRNEDINASYILSPYEKEYGILSLITSIKDTNNNIIALLVSDFDTFQLYNSLISFTRFNSLKVDSLYLNEGDVLLKETSQVEDLRSKYNIQDTLTQFSFFSYGINTPLIDEVSLFISFSSTDLLFQNLIIYIALFILFSFVLIVLFSITIKLVNNTFDSLAEINKLIIETLE